MALDMSSKKVYGALKDAIDYVDHKLDDAMVQIWSPGGSYTFENLPAPSADTFRFAYVVTDDFTTTSDFVEGAGIDYPAGTVVGVINRGTDLSPVYMYDVSTGAVFVDSEPTQGSTNAVSSGGVYDDLQEIELSISQLSASKISKSSTPGLVRNDGSIDESDYADKVVSATAGNLAGLNANGNLTDSGIHVDSNGDVHFIGDVYSKGRRLGNYKIFGFHIDSAESDPEACVTYLNDAVGMTPAKQTYDSQTGIGTWSWGSWSPDEFFIPRPCMLKFDGTVDYYLDPNDYSKKLDGSASDVANMAYGGNAMMEWGRDGQKIWVCVTPDANSSDGSSATVRIANFKVDDNYHAWSFINMNGDLVDHFYTPIYKGSLDSNNRMRSISGQDYNNYVNNKTRAEEIAYAEANNPGNDKLWFTETHADNELINYLLILLGKSLDVQTVYGGGRTGFSWSQSNVATTGVMDAKGLFYGESNTTGLGVKVFGMEQKWGDIWRAEAGYINDNGTPKVKWTYGTQDGSTASAYNTDGTGYLASDVTLPSANADYIKKMKFDSSLGMIPIDVSGSAQSYYCDTLWTNNAQNNYALRGGGLNLGRRCGAFCVSLSDAAGIRNWDVGAALSCKPLT